MTQIDPNNTQAILIGASQFDFASEAGFQDLSGVKTNLSKLNILLIEVVGIGKDSIHLMLNMDNSNAITSEIIEIVPKAEDTIIVYYAGHGIVVQKKLYLATKKTKFKKPQRTGAIESNDLVNSVIEETKAKNIIFIIDCCFSARAKEGVDSKGKKVFFITAAPSHQPAKDESPENANYTAFTHELLEIFKQGIENAGEILTLQDISNQLIKQLKERGLPEPQLSTHGSSDKLGICQNQAYQHDPADQDLQPISSAKYTKQISEITEYVENFFLFAQQEKYQVALDNGRKLVEAICKMVLFNKKGQLNQKVIYESSLQYPPVEIKIDGENYKFAINENLDKPNYQPLMLGRLIPEIQAFIPQDQVKAIRRLQQKGNLASHTSGGHRQFTEADFLFCQPQVESLVNWLFRIFFNTPLPNAIQDALNNTLIKLKTFQPLASVIKTKRTKQLFENQLLYFTPAEEEMMQQMGERLAHQHQVLLLGDPATGKSMMAFTMAIQLQEKGYQSYYCSLASADKALKDDIDALLDRKVLFIIDDCHLDIDTATDLCFQFHKNPNVTAALLFISRNISKNLQQSVQFEWFNLFEELKAETFQTESHHLETKVSGIIAKYQAYYSESRNLQGFGNLEGFFTVGDEAVIMRNFRKSLVTLSYYLDLWKEVPVLSDISDARVLETVYEKYFSALNKQQIACLLQYACLYAFEVEFESLPDDEETTEGLAKKGIISEARKHFYSFYHSDFADLLLRAYEAYEERRFQRKYKTFDHFLWVQIKKYLLSFVADYGYPDNVHAILSNIAGSQKAFLLEKLVADDELKALIAAFYAEEKDGLTLVQFVFKLSKNTPTLFNEYFENLFDKNEYFKEVFLRSKNSFWLYVRILITLRKNKVAYNVFLDNWEEQESALIENAGIQYIGIGLRNLQLHISQDKAKQLYDCFDNAFFIPKIREANLAYIGNALNWLNKVNPSKTAAIFEQIDNAFFIPKIKEANLAYIGKALNELNQVNSSKTAAILAQFDNAFFIPKIKEVNLINIGHALIELNQVNPSKTAAIFAQFDNAFFIPKIQEANLAYIGRALNELNQVNSSKTAAILAQFDNAFFIPKIKEVNLINIGHALIELNQVNPSKTAAIFAQFDNAFFTPKIQEVNLVDIGHALIELNQVNPSKTATIFAQFDNAFFIPKIQEVNLVDIGHALIELNQVNPSKTAALLEQIDNAFFIPKIQEANLAHIGNALNELNQVNPSKAAAIFENIDDNLLVQKATQLNFVRLANALFELNKVSGNKTQCIFKALQSTFTVDILTKEIETVKYEIFLYNISIFPILDAYFGKALLQNIDESYLFQWDKLKNYTALFNQLLNAFRLAEISKEDENIKQLISFAQKNKDNFLRCKNLRGISSFLQQLANYIDIQPIIKQNVGKFVGKIRSEKDQTKIPKFIGIIHANAPDNAFYLFKQFKKYYPDAQKIIGFTHYYIGKNHSEQLQLKEATHHLKKAAAIFTNINHEIGVELVQTELKQMALESLNRKISEINELWYYAHS
jgi:hypothetical protein